MVRTTRAEQHELADSPVIGIGNEYPAGHRHARHRHSRAQLLYAEYGTMLVDTQQQRWIVPPHEGVWIPGGVLHGMRMLSEVGTRSVYFNESANSTLPDACRVIGVSALLRQLLIAAADLPVDYAPDSRAARVMALIVDEVANAPVRPLNLPMPRHPRLSARCRAFAESPQVGESIEAWCHDAAMSRRTFTRVFRAETGLSLREWQRRACFQAAVQRLLDGEPVTRIALDQGYSSPAAFTAMFRSLTDASPLEYVRAFGSPLTERRR